MEEKNYLPPITVTGSGGKIHIAYDQVSVDFPPEGPMPEGAPALACRIFESCRGDLQADSRAE